MMTWGEFKRQVEAEGVRDTDVLDVVDVVLTEDVEIDVCINNDTGERVVDILGDVGDDDDDFIG